MIKNYLIVAFRNLTKHKAFTIIHLLGLAIGTASFLLILQYVSFERSYDTFHESVDDIYRVPISYSEGFGAFPKSAANHPGLGPAMLQDFPEVVAFTRFFHPSNMGQNIAFSYTKPGGQRTSSTEDKIYLADSSFFSMFSFKLLLGDAASALNRPNTIALSETLSRKYFGAEDPIGKFLMINGNNRVMVSSVYEDVPNNSHIHFEGLISFNTVFPNLGQAHLWVWPEFYTYVQLRKGTDASVVEDKFPAFEEKYLAAIHKEHGFRSWFSLQPVADIHLKSDCGNEPEEGGNARTVYFLIVLAVFILIIAWINYINLSTSKAIERAKEVGVRKVVGAEKSQLVGQFLTESILLNAVGIGLGVVLAYAFLPFFSSVVGKEIGDALLNSDLIFDRRFWLLLIGSTIFSGLISGIYPAFLLSSFRPVQVLKGRFLKSRHTIAFRRALVGFQFFLSIGLLSVTLLITKQLAFMSKKDLGYKKDNVLIIKAPVMADSTYVGKVSAFRSQLLQYPSVNAFAKGTEIPGKLMASRAGVRNQGQTKDENVPMYTNEIDDQYLSTFRVPLKAGRNFGEADRSNIFSDEINRVLVNEALAVSLGYDDFEDALGKTVIFKFGPEDRSATIIGVVANYHQRSLRESIDPILYMYPNFNRWEYFAVGLESADWSNTISMIEEEYGQTFAGLNFEYFFLDEFFDRQYSAEKRFGRVSKLIALLAILVACLGFFGLSTLVLAQRTKEIAVRKILGANISGILSLVSGSFVKMLIVANLIALPFIIYLGNRWLDNFAYNIGLHWQIFVLPIVILLSMVVLIIALQMYRTSVLNPIHSLRDE